MPRARKVCHYFLENNCKFGDSCKNRHPRRSLLTRFTDPLKRVPISMRSDYISADMIRNIIKERVKNEAYNKMTESLDQIIRNVFNDTSAFCFGFYTVQGYDFLELLERDYPDYEVMMTLIPKTFEYQFNRYSYEITIKGVVDVVVAT